MYTYIYIYIYIDSDTYNNATIIITMRHLNIFIATILHYSRYIYTFDTRRSSGFSTMPDSRWSLPRSPTWAGLVYHDNVTMLSDKSYDMIPY